MVGASKLPEVAPVVSTSAQYAAMIGIPPLSEFKPVGVNSERASPNVTFPLLFTNNELNVVPKKFTANGSGTSADEPSSFGKRTFAVNPGKCRIAPLPVKCATNGPAGVLVATVKSAVRGPVVVGLNVTPIVQLLSAPTVAPHAEFSRKSPAAFPTFVTEVILAGESAAFGNLAVCGALVDPTACPS